MSLQTSVRAARRHREGDIPARVANARGALGSSEGRGRDFASGLHVRNARDCVAKLFAALPTRNYRIREVGISNPNCALWLILESILRVGSLENSFATQSPRKRTNPNRRE
jgi:hypothetical protein